jgi:hypothetical protein
MGQHPEILIGMSADYQLVDGYEVTEYALPNAGARALEQSRRSFVLRLDVAKTKQVTKQQPQQSRLVCLCLSVCPLSVRTHLDCALPLPLPRPGPTSHPSLAVATLTANRRYPPNQWSLMTPEADTTRCTRLLAFARVHDLDWSPYDATGALGTGSRHCSDVAATENA